MSRVDDSVGIHRILTEATRKRREQGKCEYPMAHHVDKMQEKIVRVRDFIQTAYMDMGRKPM